MEWFIEVNGIPVPVEDWQSLVAKGVEMVKPISQRRVGFTTVGKWVVSTVFLSIQHGEDDEGRPLLYETAVWLDPTDAAEESEVLILSRYALRDEAKSGHIAIVQWLYDAKMDIEAAIREASDESAGSRPDPAGGGSLD